MEVQELLEVEGLIQSLDLAGVGYQDYLGHLFLDPWDSILSLKEEGFDVNWLRNWVGFQV